MNRFSDWLVRARWRRIALLAAIAVLVLIGIATLGREIDAHSHALETWIAQLGPWGMLVLVVSLVVATSLLVPESVFGFAAGALYGMAWGFALLLVANLLAAALQYTLARRWLRPRIQRASATRPLFAAIQHAVIDDEVRLQLLLRLAPMNPAAISYLLGAAGVRFVPFLLACVALTPHLLLELYVGQMGVRLARMAVDGEHTTGLDDALLVGGLLAGAMAVIVISRLAYVAVLKTTEKMSATQADDARF